VWQLATQRGDNHRRKQAMMQFSEWLRHSSVSFWLSARRLPDATSVHKLARVLGVTEADVYQAMGLLPPDVSEDEEVSYLISLLDRIHPSQYQLIEGFLRLLPTREEDDATSDESDAGPSE
jgi:transcriptional regulator with XRE-family HTH domain